MSLGNVENADIIDYERIARLHGLFKFGNALALHPVVAEPLRLRGQKDELRNVRHRLIAVYSNPRAVLASVDEARVAVRLPQQRDRR